MTPDIIMIAFNSTTLINTFTSFSEQSFESDAQNQYYAMMILNKNATNDHDKSGCSSCWLSKWLKGIKNYLIPFANVVIYNKRN